MRRCEVPGLIVFVGGQVVEGMVGAGGMVKSLMPRCWQAAISSVRERAALRPADASEERAQPRPSHREYHAQRVLASFGPTTPGTQAPGRGPVSSSSSRCASPRFRIWLTPPEATPSAKPMATPKARLSRRRPNAAPSPAPTAMAEPGFGRFFSDMPKPNPTLRYGAYQLEIW